MIPTILTVYYQNGFIVIGKYIHGVRKDYKFPAEYKDYYALTIEGCYEENLKVLFGPTIIEFKDLKEDL